MSEQPTQVIDGDWVVIKGPDADGNIEDVGMLGRVQIADATYVDNNFKTNHAPFVCLTDGVEFWYPLTSLEKTPEPPDNKKGILLKKELTRFS